MIKAVVIIATAVFYFALIFFGVWNISEIKALELENERLRRIIQKLREGK